jgi:predicted  nucleic acid-binding Zn-ribbon protein
MPDFDLKEQLPLLYELQQIDTEILAAHQKLKSVPTKIKRLEDSFQIHRQKLEEKKEQLANVEREWD